MQAKEGGVELFICLIDGEDNFLAEYAEGNLLTLDPEEDKMAKMQSIICKKTRFSHFCDNII